MGSCPSLPRALGVRVAGNLGLAVVSCGLGQNNNSVSDIQIGINMAFYTNNGIALITIKNNHNVTITTISTRMTIITITIVTITRIIK